MSQRNYNNITTVGTLVGPIASSAISISVQNFSQTPAVPFTATLDRNLPTEEIILVTAYAGGTVTATRGYDGTAAQSHSAGAAIEHTAGAIEYTEANGHVNATTNVHGVTGGLVGTQGAQTILDKTIVSPVLQADVSAGDAVVAQVPTAAGTRNLFRGVGSDGLDKITIDQTGKIISAGTPVTTLVAGATNAATANQLVKRDASGNAAFGTATVSNAPAAGTDATNKTYVDNKTWPSTAISDAVPAPTASVVVKRDSSGRAQFADPAAAQDAATKNYVDTTHALLLGKMWGTTGTSAGVANNSSVTVAFNTSRTAGGVTFAANKLTLPQDGFWELTYKGYATGANTGAVAWNLYRTRSGVGDAVCDAIQFHKASAGSDEAETGSAIVPLKASDTLYLQMGVANASGAISYAANSEGGGVMVQARYIAPLNGATPL